MLIGSTISLNTMMLGSTSFTPATLFSRGEQGVWLDPSDVANLNWLVNLLTWTQEFDNAVWSKNAAAIVVNSITAPDGTLTADTLLALSGTGLIPRVGDTSVNTVQSAAHTVSIYAKAGTYNFLQIYIISQASEWVNYTLTGSGTVSVNGSCTATITLLSDGWYRLTMTYTAGGTDRRPFFAMAASGTATRAQTWNPVGTETIFIWGAQLELGSVVTPYQAITTVNEGVVERFPLNTMFQDRAGTTPVTTPGQLVGLRLDKSQQLALGPELGGPLLVSTGWTTDGCTVTASGSGLNFAFTDTNKYAFKAIATTVGKRYKFVIQASGHARNIFWSTIGLSGNLFGAIAASNTTTGYFVATTTSSVFGIASSSGAGTTSVSSISVREIAGNHAVAVSDATRGTYGIEPYGGRRNLLTWTEQFDNAAWTNAIGTKPTVTVNAAVAPDGTLTADLLNFSAQFQAVSQGSRTIGAVYTESVWMRVDSGTRTINLTDGAGTILGTFTVTTSWQRFTATYTAANAVTGWQDRNSSGFVGVYIWGAQLEVVPTATTILSPYQRVTTQWDVTEAGVPTVYYVDYDNDAYVTPTIDPSLNPPLGPEMITNGDFSAGAAGWYSLGSGLPIPNSFVVDGALQVSNTTVQNAATTIPTLAVSNTVVVNFRARSVSGNVSAWVRFSNAFGANIVTAAALGTLTPTWANYQVTFTNTGVARSVFSFREDNGTGMYEVDNVSVRELVTDEVQVFAGVRKLSDAAAGVVVEFSADRNANNGSWTLSAPAGTAPSQGYFFASKGTLDNGQVNLSTGYPPPITNVLTSIGDISADVATLRVNSTQVGTSSGDQGTGSYGAYPLYIGARGGSSTFFRGRDYGIIVRFGPNLSNTMILDTEEWLGNKTGVLYVLWNGVWQDQYTWVDNLNWNDGV